MLHSVWTAKMIVPPRLGPDLSAAGASRTRNVDMIVALAYREYETWFHRGRHDRCAVCVACRTTLIRHNAPEAIRDAKGWLGERMDVGYDPVIHQLEFSAGIRPGAGADKRDLSIDFAAHTA